MVSLIKDGSFGVITHTLLLQQCMEKKQAVNDCAYNRGCAENERLTVYHSFKKQNNH